MTQSFSVSLSDYKCASSLKVHKECRQSDSFMPQSYDTYSFMSVEKKLLRICVCVVLVDYKPEHGKQVKKNSHCRRSVMMRRILSDTDVESRAADRCKSSDG